MTEFVEGDWSDYYQLVKVVGKFDIRYHPPKSRGRKAYRLDAHPIEIWIGDDKSLYRAFSGFEWVQFVEAIKKAHEELKKVIDESDKKRDALDYINKP